MSRSRNLTMISSATLVFAAGAMLQGCEGLADWSSDAGLPIQESAVIVERPEPSVELKQTQHEVVFTGGSTSLSAPAAGRLLGFLNDIGLARGDSVSLVSPALPASASNAQRLAHARREQAVRALLEKNDLQVSSPPADATIAAPNVGTISVVARRYVVRLPACPDWTASVWDNFDNQPHSNWGCATAINFGLMVANPRDLIEGRPAPIADGELQARAIERYRLGKTKDLIRQSASSDTFAVGESSGEE